MNLKNRNPLITTSFGTGELIKTAQDRGVKTIIIGIGGIAINDGGAAGGFGAGLIAFLDAKLYKGIDIVIKHTNLKKHMEGVDFIFTGEISIDSQIKYGKRLYGVAMTAKELKIPVVAVVGVISKDIDKLYYYGFSSFFSIVNSISSLEEALKNGKNNIEMTCENIGRVIKLSLEKQMK